VVNKHDFLSFLFFKSTDKGAKTDFLDDTLKLKEDTCAHNRFLGFWGYAVVYKRDLLGNLWGFLAYFSNFR